MNPHTMKVEWSQLALNASFVNFQNELKSFQFQLSKRRHNTHHNDILYNDVWQNGLNYAHDRLYADCRYAEYNYAECSY